MSRKIIFTICIIMFALINIYCLYAKETHVEEIYISKIVYYGDYSLESERNYMLHEEDAKLPILLESWPVLEYYKSPDLITVKAEIVNQSKQTIRNVVLGVEIRYKAGKVISDANGNTDIEKSKKNTRWMNSFFKKDIVIKEISQGKKVYSITTFNLGADLERYSKTDEQPWFCETKLVIKNNLKKTKGTSKILPIGVWEEG